MTGGRRAFRRDPRPSKRSSRSAWASRRPKSLAILQIRREIRGTERAGIEIALAIDAAHGAQAGGLFGPLDPLGDRVHHQRPRKGDDRVHDLEAVLFLQPDRKSTRLNSSHSFAT